MIKTNAFCQHLIDIQKMFQFKIHKGRICSLLVLWIDPEQILSFHNFAASSVSASYSEEKRETKKGRK